MSQEQADELQERLVEFAVAIIRVVSKLPSTPVGRRLAVQMLHSGTSPAPNYGEARGAESRADFAHKLRIALKELNETAIWLEIIAKSRLVSEKELDALRNENSELARILTASVKTLRSGRKNDK